MPIFVNSSKLAEPCDACLPFLLGRTYKERALETLASFAYSNGNSTPNLPGRNTNLSNHAHNRGFDVNIEQRIKGLLDNKLVSMFCFNIFGVIV